MKNKLNVLLVLMVVLFIGLGCGITERVQKSISGDNTAPQSSDSNKSTTDKVVENLADGETTGVKECDEALTIIADQAKNPDDNFVTKATKDYIFGQIKKSIRESIEQNQGDKAKMGEQCAEYKKQLEKQLQAEKEKKPETK